MHTETDLLTVLLKDGLGGRRQTRLPLPFTSLNSLVTAVKDAFQPELDTQEFYLAYGTSRIIDSDAAARKLKPGDQLQVGLGAPSPGGPSTLSLGRSKPPGMPKGTNGTAMDLPSKRQGHSLGSGFKTPAKERISFVPHPKTLTMAGDYEYFAARGHHPFAFALAELIDNSLRATKGLPGAKTDGISRNITISLVSNERGTAGIIRVQDNGRGMSPKELGEWAVMNLSMEDRGLLPSGGQRASEEAGGGRYLSGDLSYFGVGSKNAAFFMGSSVKLATRQAVSPSVHELYIAGAELERRYKCGENVYEEDMVHREPGDDSTLSKEEKVFPTTRSWLAEEASSTSFTRVNIADLRPEVLSLLSSSDSGAMVCRDLAHLYHYYLHGPAGNVGPNAPEVVDSSNGAAARKAASTPGILPGGEVMPCITVEHIVGSRRVWQRQLVEVDDDLESRYVRAAKAQMEFELEVPGKGTVEGVLWYFPYTDGAETVPQELGAAAYSVGAGPQHQAGAPGILTQLMQDRPTQMTLHGAAALATQLVRAGRASGGGAATQAGQLPEQMQQALADILVEEEAKEVEQQGQGQAPMFETFWQGRLIPGSGLDNLPFIDTLRAKLRGSSSGKDYLPDDVFSRIRGALFFGPAWRVTRNKLTFRDPLTDLLASATPTDRGLDKRLREWLRDCHTRLDRILHFKCPADVELKAVIRKELGESMTGFMQVSDGTRTISAGDVVRLSTKPPALGRIKYFSVPQASAAEGVYATGFVTFSGLPAFLHGPRHSATLSLRRVEEVVSQAAVEEYTARERGKMPSFLRLEPLRLASGRRIDVEVGEAVPDTAVTLHNTAGQRLIRTFLQGQKVALRVRQRLVYMGPKRPSAYCVGPATTAADEAPDGGGLAAQDLSAEAVAPAALPAADDPNGASNAAAAPAEATEGTEPPGRKKGQKRRKKNAVSEQSSPAGGKENHVPEQPPQRGGKRAKRSSVVDIPPESAANGAVAMAAKYPGAVGPLPEGVGEVVLDIENKKPVESTYMFSKITGGLTRSGTYFLEYCMLPELPPGCDPAGGPGPVTIWSRTVLYASAGPAVRFELRGEARAVLAAKSVALGEMLPPLQLVCYDAQDNEVAAGAENSPGLPGAKLEVIRSDEAAAGQAEALQRLEEIELEWQAVPGPGGLIVQGIRPKGCTPYGTPMRLFGGPGIGGDREGLMASVDVLSCTPAGAQKSTPVPSAAEVDLQLRVTLFGLPSQVLPLKLRPGAPAALRLLPGHPFTGSTEGPSALVGHGAAAGDMGGLEPVNVMNGEALPEFQVMVLDAWGNPTGPSPDLPAKLELEGPMLQPNPVAFDIDASGKATVRGVRAVAQGQEHIGARQDVVLSIRCNARGAGPRAALELAEAAIAEAGAAAGGVGGATGLGGGLQGWARMALPLVLQPCTLPAGLQILYEGQPCEVGPSASGDGLAALLRGIPAGSHLTGLSLILLDEGGRPAEPGFKGKLQLSWAKGTKKVTVSEVGARIELPPLPVREQVSAEPLGAWVRFVGEGRLLAGVTLETSLEVTTVAGPPVSWGVSLVGSTAGANGGGGGPGPTSQNTENLGLVACGAAICLEIEAHDAHGNRCAGWAGPGARPTPTVVPCREVGDAPLLYDPADWVCGWELSQHTGAEVYHVRLALGGSAGPVKLVVRDSQGPGGESLLQPDELPVELTPGSPTTLAFDGPQHLQCGTRGCLGDLRVRVTDDWGNTVEGVILPGGRGNKDQGSGLEVTMQTSAIATDGSGCAAKVAAATSNKTRVVKGWAVLRDIKVEGAPGSYAVRVGSASRKIALQEAMLVVEIVAQNIVRHVTVAPCSLPEEPLEPGTYLELVVQVTTENLKPLPYEAASGGLALRLKAPSAEAAAAARGDGDAAAAPVGGGAGAGGSSAAACTVVLQPRPQEEGLSLNSRELWSFVTPGPLVVGGEYSVTAEYLELRPELARCLSKSEQTVRSISHAFELLPGPAMRATLEQDTRTAAGGPLLVTNGSDAAGRSLLTAAAVQLRDEYGNAVALDGVRVRWVLVWPGAEECEVEGADCDEAARLAHRLAAAAGAQMPTLQSAMDDTPYVVEALTDARGRAFFTEVAIVEGSGRVAALGRDGTDVAPALHLELKLQVALRPTGGPSAGGVGQWQTCWSAPVVFSDDAARAAMLQRLCGRREELAAAVARQEEAKSAADRALDAAEQAVRQAQAEVDNLARRSGAGAVGGQLQSSSEARELLHRLREQHQRAASTSQQRRDTIAARFGSSTSGIVMALNRCLSAPEGQGEVVGVMAQLATVDNPHLSALLSAAFSSTLQILVVRSYECIKRLREMLTAKRNQLPSMLATNMVQGFTGDGGRQAAEAVAAMRNVSQEALELQAAACEGADPPLAMLLPHTRMLLGASPDRLRAVSGAGPAAHEWPSGCLGYAVNLVRPVVAGHRPTIFYSQMGRTLVFETLDQAAAYRTYVVQALSCSGLGDIYTLDGSKLSGRGVVVGSGFRVVPIEEANVRFGAAQSSQAAVTKQLTQQISDVEALAAALEATEAASSAVAQAQEEAEAAEQRLVEVQREVAEELQQLEGEIAGLAGPQPGGGSGRGGPGRQRGGRGPKRTRDVPVGEGDGPSPAADASPEQGRGNAEAAGKRSKRSKGQGRMASMK